jgi:hypothetical protein
MQWCVTLQAVGERTLTREEVVELADAVAPMRGVASGIGQTAYGADLIVESDTREEAIELGTEAFARAVVKAALPPWPVATVSAVNEEESDEEDW